MSRGRWMGLFAKKGGQPRLWVLYDQDTGTRASIEPISGRFLLVMTVDGVDERFQKDFATLGAAKAWYTKNFG